MVACEALGRLVGLLIRRARLCASQARLSPLRVCQTALTVTGPSGVVDALLSSRMAFLPTRWRAVVRVRLCTVAVRRVTETVTCCREGPTGVTVQLVCAVKSETLIRGGEDGLDGED